MYLNGCCWFVLGNIIYVAKLDRAKPKLAFFSSFC
uniref:Uncharacterized protein n=1 Tax=Setaria italica TaxID=4555 RepID=K3ZPJ0_SETIT